MFLLLTSGCEGDDAEAEYDINSDEYEKSIEERLSLLISEIEGAGKVKVMVTSECGREYVYAENSEVNENEEKTSYFTDGDREALPIKEVMPKIRGVAVVCSGGDKLSVQSKVIALVSSVLDIPSNRIFVGS